MAKEKKMDLQLATEIVIDCIKATNDSQPVLLKNELEEVGVDASRINSLRKRIMQNKTMGVPKTEKFEISTSDLIDMKSSWTVRKLRNRVQSNSKPVDEEET